MKYTLSGFYQDMLMLFQKEQTAKDGTKKIISLNRQDIDVLAWLMDVWHARKFVRHINPDDNLEYVNIQYDAVVDEFPLLFKTKQSVYDTFKRLTFLHLVKHYHHLKGGSYSCYRPNEEVISLIRYNNVIPDEKTLAENLDTLYKILLTPLCFFIDPSIKNYRAKYPFTNPFTISSNDSKESLSASCEAPPVDQDKSPLPKRTKPIVPPTAPADPGELCEFVEYWNEQENTPKHRQPSTGVYKQAAKHCNQLRHGIFGRSVELKPEWLANKHIPPDLPRKKWTREEIKEGIRRMALMYKDGYWPPKKDSLPRSFQAMLYNPKSGGSWFLWVMSSEPRPIAESVKPLDDAVHAMYRKLFKGKALTDAEETKLVRMVNLLVGKQREVAQHLEPYLGHTSFSGKFGSRNNRFFQTHIDWLTGWCEDIRVETVWKTWGAFVRWARDFHKMEIEPSNDNVRAAKQAHRRAEEDRRRREESAERSRLSELAHLV